MDRMDINLAFTALRKQLVFATPFFGSSRWTFSGVSSPLSKEHWTSVIYDMTHRQFLDNCDPFGYGKSRQTLACVGLELQGELHVLTSPTLCRLKVQNHEGHWALAPLWVLTRHDRHLEDVGVTSQFCNQSKRDLRHDTRGRKNKNLVLLRAMMRSNRSLISWESGGGESGLE